LEENEISMSTTNNKSTQTIQPRMKVAMQQTGMNFPTANYGDPEIQIQHKWRGIIDKVMRNEGGYVNDPLDPGGETKYGISSRLLEAIKKPDYPDKELHNYVTTRTGFENIKYLSF